MSFSGQRSAPLDDGLQYAAPLPRHAHLHTHQVVPEGPGPPASPSFWEVPNLAPNLSSASLHQAARRSDSDIEASWSVLGPLRHVTAILRSSFAKPEVPLEDPLLEPGKDYYTPTEKAVLYIQDAYDGQVRVQPRNTALARLAHAIHLRLQGYVRWMAVMLLLLSFVERPQWCDRFSRPGMDACRQPDLYLTSGLPYLPSWLQRFLEAFCLSALLLDILLQVLYQGPGRFGKIFRQTAALVLVLAAVMDFAASLIWPNFFRLSEILRAAIVLNFSRHMRVEIRLMGRLLPALATIGCTASMILLFFAWSGTLIFDSDSPEGQRYFPNLLEAMWSLLILTTATNFPDVMMPAYEGERASCLFFIVFLMLSVFLFMSIVLAVIFQEYSSAHKAQVERSHAKQQSCLAAAFRILDTEGKGFLDRHQFLALVREMQGFRGLTAPLGEEGANLLFALADRRRDGRIHPSEFSDLCWLLKIRIERVDTHRIPFARLFPEWAGTESFRTFQQRIAGRFFDNIVSIVLLLNAVALLLEDWSRLWGGPRLGPPMLYIALDTLFNIFYISEVVLKVGVLGWTRYWRRFKNKFDLILTILATGTSVLILLPEDISQHWHLLAHFAVFRLLRLMRLLRLVNLPAKMQGTVQHVLAVPVMTPLSQTLRLAVPRAVPLLSTLFCVMMCYAALGVALFGGLINRDPLQPQYDILKNTDFGMLDYYPNSMNDIGTAMVTLFELLVVNNWWVIAQGYVEVTSHWARFFFVGWYLLGVVVLVNILVALILDTFIAGYARALKLAELQGRAAEGLAESMHGPSRQSRLEGGARVFEAALVTRADVNVEGKFIATVPGFEDDAEKDLRLKRLLQGDLPREGSGEGALHRSSISHLM